MTTFGDQVFQFGGVPVGSGMLPPMGPSAKAFFVHGSLGLDGNSGLRPSEPLKTLTQAYALCTDGAGDVVYIMNDGSTTATVRDVALVWAKDNCHIVGLGAPGINQRARISTVAGDTDVDAYTPYLTLSASGCSISNVSWFQGNSEDAKSSVGHLVSGSRNYFNNVSIITGAHANQGDEAATYNLQVTGHENVWEKCYIGQDTAARSNVANANVAFGLGNIAAPSQAARNVFRECIFPMFADGIGPLFVSVLVLTDIQRWNLFQRCNFINTGTSTLTAGVSVPGSATGRLFFDNCGFFGCTDVTAADSVLVYMLGPTPGTPANVGMYNGVDIA